VLLPKLLELFLLAVGVIATAQIIIFLCKNLFYYLKFKSLPLSVMEQKYKLLQEENLKLNTKVLSLEKENNEITLTILQRLNN